MTKKAFTVVVGDDKPTLVLGYVGHEEEILKACRKYVAKGCNTAFITDPRLLCGFRALHRMGELSVSVLLKREFGEEGPKEFDGEYILDDRGDFIESWPDYFLDVEFRLDFGKAYKEI